jgi:hypothetical protein
MHPWDRLHRRVTGQDLWEPSGLATDLWARDRELRQPREVPGEKVKSVDFKVKKATKTVEPRPNAPLLKRVVRHPYALGTERGKRSTLREAVPWKMLDREALPSVTTLTRELLEGASLPNPIEVYGSASRIETRPRPSAEAWLKGRAR